MGSEYIQRHLPSLHCDHKGISKSEAQSMFIREASDSSSSSAHNFHLYKMVSNKKSSTISSSDTWLAITITGLMIYSADLNASGHNRRLKTRISFFPWSDIGKLSFDKKKFEIRSTGPQSRKFIYYTQSEEIARFLLWFSRASHQFHLMALPKMREMLKREAEINRRKYRESCISSTLAINGNTSRNSSSGNSSGISTGSQRNRTGNRHNHSNANSGNTSKSVSPFEFSSVVSSNSDTKKGTSDLDISTLSVCCSIDMLNDGAHCKGDDRQRVSVISNASSNTTSGIASDKMHDGLCEDSDPESDLLMSLNRHHINTHRAIIGLSGCSPQPVVSMESLAMSEPIDHHRSCHPNHLIHTTSKSEMMRNKKHSVSISNIMITANAGSSSSSSSSVVVPSTEGSISSFIGSNSPSVKALAVQHSIANNVDETKKGSKILLRLNMENKNRIAENDKDDNDDNDDSYDDIDGNSTSMFDNNNRYHNGSSKSNVTVLSTILKPEAERLLKQGIEADEVATELNNNHHHIDSFELQELKEFEQAEKEKIILNSLIDNIPPPPTSLHDDDSSDSSSSSDDSSSESDDECENKDDETSNNGGHYSPTAQEKCLHKTNDSSLNDCSSNRTHSRMRSKSSAASIETTNTSIKLPTMKNNWTAPVASKKHHIYENVSTLENCGNFDSKYSQVVQALITPGKHSMEFSPSTPLRPYPSLNSVPVATCNGHPPFRGTGMKIGVSSLARGNISQNNALLQNGYQPIMNKSINYPQNYLVDSLQNISAAGSEPNLYYGATNKSNSVRNNLDNTNDYLWKTSTPKNHHVNNNKFGHLVQNQLGYGTNSNEIPSKCTFNASKLKLDLSMLNQSAAKTNGHLSTKKPTSVIVPTSDSVYITPPPSADYTKKCSNEQISPSKLVTSQAVSNNENFVFTLSKF